eukprot:TRINITY_DN3177_c0_g1_i2.p1 TRINITY_DN3177_c0_g1~~TRINITY_DN3177_c0_g1_i2.p1  ORF type:complete len:698 (-),score=204.42 TRINITY_DN3177_c0_g1_i2:25-2118(-)
MCIRDSINAEYGDSRSTTMASGEEEQQLAEAIAQQAELGRKVAALKAQEPQDKAAVANMVAALKKVKQQVSALSKQCNPEEENELVASREALETLCLRRFFYRQAFSIYGGTGGFYTYGPPGCAAKTNLISLWRKHFIIEDNMMEIEDTCIMPKPVLTASGHVERFNDFMVKDSICTEKFFRADHLLEDEMDRRLAEPGLSQEEKDELHKVRALADACDVEELHSFLTKYEVKAPDTGNPLSEPYEFNLMYPTSIGPTGDQVGYLRPETAQGIFLNYKFCYEQNGGAIPFGIAQVGKAFRNEIAPRGGLIRQREFTQCEIEYFVQPGEKKYPQFFSKGIDQLECTLWPSEQQLSAQKPIQMKLGDAVARGIIANETLAYFVGRVHLFLKKAGIVGKWLRFRQHLPTEMAHYACDCWDAEVLISHGWTECVGIADRSAFDLEAHAEATGDPGLKAAVRLDTPIQVQELTLPNKGPGKMIGKTFKKDAKAITAYLQALPQDQAIALRDAGGGEVVVGGQSFTLGPEHVAFELQSVEKHVHEFVPHVIEPSLGIDRVLYAIFEHAYRVREAEDGDDKGQKEKRHVLSFSHAIAPYMAGLFPQDQRVFKQEGFASVFTQIVEECTMAGVSVKPDTSGAGIGKKLSLIHISEPTRLLSISYAVFCLKKKKKITNNIKRILQYTTQIKLNSTNNEKICPNINI